MDDKGIGATPADARSSREGDPTPTTQAVSVSMPLDGLYDLSLYWADVHEYGSSFDPTIKIRMPAAEYGRFNAYRQDPGAFKRAQRYDGNQANADGQPDMSGSGCKSGCKLAAIILAIGVVACILVIVIATIVLYAPQREEQGRLVSVEVNGSSFSYEAPEEDEAAHRRFLEAVQQPGDAAYLVRVPEPNNARKVSSYVFVPVEITHEGEEGFSTTNYLFCSLKPNENARDIFYSAYPDSSLSDTVEEFGYPALSRALSEGDFGQASGTHLVFFAFDADVPEYWDPQVNFHLSEDGRTLKSFTYRTQAADLEDLESIAQAGWGRGV